MRAGPCRCFSLCLSVGFSQFRVIHFFVCWFVRLNAVVGWRSPGIVALCRVSPTRRITKSLTVLLCVDTAFVSVADMLATHFSLSGRC